MQESIKEESETCLGDPILDEDVGSFTILNEGDEAFVVCVSRKDCMCTWVS